MSCIRPDKLADFARGREDARSAAHLAECARCKTSLERVRASLDGMRAMMELPTPEVGVIRGEATVRWARLEKKPRLRWQFAASFGLAAATAALMLMWNGGARPVEEKLVRAVAPPRVREARLQAVVTLLGGKVEMTRAGATQALAATAMLQGQDRLASSKDARVAAQWNADEGFLLHGDSEMSIARLERGAVSLDLARGRLDVRRGGHDPEESLEVVTPGRVVRARGTWFAVAASREVLTVEVLEGTVEVKSPTEATLLHAPVRAVFGAGPPKVTPIGAHEAAAQKRKNEMNLLPAPLHGTTLIDIASEPAGTLAVDGVELGPTPLTVRRSTGRHYVEIARPGFAPVQQWVTVGSEAGELRVALPPRASETDRSAPLDPVEIEGMIRKRSTQIRACYERRLKVDPELSGTVSLRLRVGEAGQVKQVSVEESTLPDPLVGECLRREARGWAFAVGRNATIVYPFVFRPQ